MQYVTAWQRRLDLEPDKAPGASEGLLEPGGAFYRSLVVLYYSAFKAYSMKLQYEQLFRVLFVSSDSQCSLHCVENLQCKLKCIYIEVHSTLCALCSAKD